jgi:hypothetical protein
MNTRGAVAEEVDEPAGIVRSAAAQSATASGRSTAGTHPRRRFRDFSDGPIEDLGPVDAMCGGTRQGTTDRLEDSIDAKAMAERSVEQARQACDGLLGAAHRLVDTFGGQADTVGKGAREIAERAMTLARWDIANSFDFAQKLVRARNVQDVLKLQAEYLRARMQLFSPKR